MSVLSVVIPTYNMEQWLPVAIESCLAQTACDIEIIVLNDGSTDRSGDIAERYAREEGRVRHLFQSNAGLGAARQAGQRAAGGDFITWLDADDALAPEAARVMLDVAVRDNVPLVCGNATVFSDKTFNTRRYFPHAAASHLNFAGAPAYWKSKVVWRWIFSLPFLQTGRDGAPFPHPHFKLGQDVCFMYDVLTRAEAFSQCAANVYFFRQEHKSISSSPEVWVEHELAQFAAAREILLAPRHEGRFIKPLIKYLNENYWRDIKRAAPMLLTPDGAPRSTAAACLAQRVEELGLALFSGLDPAWFSQDFLAPELRAEPGLLPFAQAFMAGDRATARRIFAELARLSPRDIDKTRLFHTARRRFKALCSPRSREARRVIRYLEARARQRLGAIWR